MVSTCSQRHFAVLMNLSQYTIWWKLCISNFHFHLLICDHLEHAFVLNLIPWPLNTLLWLQNMQQYGIAHKTGKEKWKWIMVYGLSKQIRKQCYLPNIRIQCLDGHSRMTTESKVNGMPLWSTELHFSIHLFRQQLECNFLLMTTQSNMIARIAPDKKLNIYKSTL